MKLFWKRSLAMLLVVLMVMTVAPATVFATGETETTTEESTTTSPEATPASDEPVAKVGNTEYTTINEAIANWTNGTTLTLLSDVILSDVITLKSTEHHILDLGTYTMTAASGKNAIVIQACGTGDAERTAITINADATNPGGINAGSKSVIYYKYADGGITGNDRPIIKINGGVFTGATSTWGTAGICTIGTAARKCATLNISGGTFNCSINGSGKSKLLISGGTFNYSVGSQGDSTALRLISGGKFKTLGFMTADSNNTKFWFGTSMANSNVGLYVDSDGYLVVGGPVITEVSATYPAVASNATKWSSYLQYSAAATYGLFYESVEMAIEKHGEANVTVYEKPAITIPETVTGDSAVVEEIKNNTALKGYTPEIPENVEELVIELKSVEDKIVYDVTPMADDVKVEPSAAITFRLPIPASVTDTYAKVYHDGDTDPMGYYKIQGENDAKYIEIYTDDFSEFAVETITPTTGYYLTIYNADGTVGMVIDGTKSVSVFCIRTAIEDARVFANNGFLFGIAGPATCEIEMFEDSTEDKSFTIGADVTINGNGHKIVLGDGVTLTNNGTLNNVVVEEPAAPAVKIGTQGYATLAEAIAAASAMTGDVTVEIYDKVTLDSPITGNFDSITFVGKDTDAEIYIDLQGVIYATGEKVAFEDLKLSKVAGGYIADAGFMNLAFGIYAAEEVAYTNCTFVNGAYASSGKNTFTGCTFYRSHDRYGMWAYGAESVVVDGCTFADIRGIKIYDEGKAGTTNLTVKNTDFSQADNKPAIVLTYGNNVTLENNTYSASGVFELDLDGNPNGVVVNSDVPPTCVNDNGACGVLVGGKIYTTVAQAAEVATSGSTVTLLHDSAETVELAEGVNLNKNGFEATGVTVKTPSYVAEVNGIKYEDLQEAIKAAQNGATVTLLADIDVGTGNALIRGKEITIDLNGHNITGTGYRVLFVDLLASQNKDGKLTLVGNGTVENTDTTSGSSYAVYVGGNSELVVEAGATVKSANGYAVFVAPMGAGRVSKLTVNGGTVTGRYAVSGSGQLTDTSTVITVNSGAVIGTEVGIYQPQPGTVTVNGGTVSGGQAALAMRRGTASITDGTIKGLIDVVGDYDATNVAITGGDFTNATLQYADGNGNVVTKADAVELAAPADYKWVNGVLTACEYVAEINGVKFESLADAIAAAQAGDKVVIVGAVAGEAVVVDKNLTITGEVTLTNVSINATAGKLTVSNLTFTGNSWINAGGCDELVVDNVTANVSPSNTSYTNSRSAFIGLGRNESKQLKLTVTNCNIVVPSGTDAVLGWATVTEVTISGNTFGSEASYQNKGDIVKFMAIADGAVLNITDNTSYSNYNGFVFAQNTTRDNAYTVYASGNTFHGSADHIWIEISGGDTVHAKVEATSDNTVNGNAFTAADIKYDSGAIKTWDGYAGVDVTTDSEGKLTGGSFLLAPSANTLADGFEAKKNDDGTYGVVFVPSYVAQIGDTKYETLEEAIAAAASADGAVRIELLCDSAMDSVINTEDYYYITKDLTIGTADDANYTVSGCKIAICLKDGAKLTIEKTVTIKNLDVIANGFVTSGENLVINGTVKALSLKQWSSNGTITVGTTGSVWLGYGDGQLDMAFGNGGIVINGTLTDTSNLAGVDPQFKAGYSGTRGNGNTLTLNNTYFEAGAWFNVNGSNVTINVNNSVLKVSGGDNSGSLTVAAGNVIYVKEGSILDCANITIDENAKIVINGGILKATNVTNNGAIEVYGESTINIDALTGNSIDLCHGAIVKDSTIGGKVFVAGNVTFRGKNSVVMLSDFGTLTDYYSTEAPMAWTVEKGGSLTVTDKSRYGLGYGDNVTIYGSLEDALSARDSLTEDDVVLFMHGLVAQESKGWNCDSVMTVKDAYVVIGSNNSFGNKPGNYGGTYTFNFENVVLDASRITFYEALSTTAFTFKNSDVKLGTFMTNDADSVFTLINTVLLSTATANGNDEGNYNAGKLILTNSSLTYSVVMTNKGEITIDLSSVLVAPAIKGEGKIIIDATGFDGTAVTVVKADMSGFTGTIEVVGTRNAVYNVTDEGIVIVEKTLSGSGTEEDPYIINNVEDLEFFKASVNAGETKYNAEGVYVALGADIDLGSVANWTPIGNWDHSFDSNFNGQGHKIMNLKMSDNTAANGEAYLGFFGITANNVIENFVIENVTIESNGQIVAAAIAYPYYTTVKNITVCGDIAIKGGNYTAGVLAYTRLCQNASNLTVSGNAGSYITGAQVVGGVIADIQMNYGLVANYSNFSVSGVTITGTKMVGGISGIIANQTLNGATVKNVTLVSDDARVGIVAGSLGGTSTITNVTTENVTGATSIIGGVYDGGEAVEAKIDNKYYTTLEAALKAAQAGNVVELLVPIVIEKDEEVVLDLNGATVVYNSTTQGEAMITNKGTLTINDSVGTGVINYNYTGAADPSYSKGNHTISNGGTLTINGGKLTIANLSSHAKYVIDNNSTTGDAILVINGGHLYNYNTSAIRQFCNSTTNKNSVTINGGVVEGYCAIWVQNPGKNTVNATLTIADGEIKSTAKAYVNGTAALKDVSSAIYFTVDGNGGAWSEDSFVSITGGTFNENVYLVERAPAATIGTDATFNGYVQLPVASINGFGYATLAEALAAAQNGNTVKLLADITSSTIITIDKAITLDGNGKTLTSTAGRAINVSGADGVKIMNLTIDAKGERAINIIQGATNIIINNVTATAANYTVNVAGSAANAKVTIQNSNLTGLNVVNVGAAGAIVTVAGGTITCNDQTDVEDYAALALNKDAKGASITANGVTFVINGNSDMASNQAENGKITIDGSSDSVVEDVAYIGYGDTWYGFATLEAAIAKAQAGDTIILLRDVTIDKIIKIEKAITIDLNGHKVTATSQKAFEVYANATIKNGTIEAAQRCVDTRKAVELTLTDVTLIADNYTSYGNPQPLTIGGSENGTKVTMTNVNISAEAGYGIITFVKTELTATKSTIGGYNALYVKPGSENSTFNFVDCDLSGSTVGNDAEGNSFSTIAVRANDVTVYVDADSTITATGNYCWAISMDSNFTGETGYTGAKITVAGTINGQVVASIDASKSTVTLKAEYADEVTADGYAYVTNNDGTITLVKAVAKIGDTYYATLAEAIAAAQAGETITLLADVNEVVSIEKSITLDLNGKTISSSDDTVSVLKGATVTIKNGTLVSDGEYCGGVYVKNASAILVNCIIKSTNTKRAYAVYASSGAKVTITECELIAKDYAIAMLNATVIINSGTFTADASVSANGTDTYDDATLTIHNGTFNGSIYWPANGKLTINDGTFTDDTAIFVKSGSLEINGGTFTGNGETKDYEYTVSGAAATGAAIVIENVGASEYDAIDSVAIKGGTFISVNNVAIQSVTAGNDGIDAVTGFISGGTFNTEIPEVLCAAGYIPTKNADGTYGVKVGKFVAQIGDVKYESFADAYTAANVGDTITLLAPIVVEAGETLTLDKGVTITYTSNVVGEDMITVYGILNVAAGKITYVNNSNGSNVTVSTISAVAGSVVNVTGGSIENKSVAPAGSSSYAYAIDMLTNGSMGDVTVKISDGTVYSDYMAIRQFNNGNACKNTLTVTGGYIYGAKRAIQIHMDNNAAYLTISGGKIEAGEGGYALCLFNKSNTVSVTGGEFIGDVWYSGESGFVSGGTFTMMYEEYVDEEYILIQNTNGTYGVRKANYVARVDGVGYENITEAINAAMAQGKSVVLESDIKVDMLVVNPNVDFDLNGHIVESSFVAAFGNIVDNGETTGGIKVASSNSIILQPTNTQMPLYDATNGCYRFYEYSTRAASKENGTTVTFGVSIDFVKAEAYLLLADAASSGMEITFNVTWTGKDSTIIYSFNSSTIRQYAEDAYKNLTVDGVSLPKGALILNLKGVDQLESGVTITSTIAFTSVTNVTAQKTINYSVPSGQ